MSTKHILQAAAVAAILATATALTGCGTPGAPQPPSLNLPVPVTDLNAVRAGNRVVFTWTMPKRNTDKMLLKGNIAVTLCFREGISADCTPVGDDLSFAPGAAAAVTQILPEEFTAGAPRPQSYFVEVRNSHGRTVGPSNVVVVLLGAAPPPVDNLTAEVRKTGVVLRWNPAGESNGAVRLRRKLLTPPAAKPQPGLLTPLSEPVEQSLLVEANAGSRALDKTIRFGQTYEYRAQRVARVTLDGKTLELAGELSAPVRFEVRDIFPPEAPTGLAAVATTGETPAQASIDLSWQPVPDANLAGYIIYRRESDTHWQRISPAELLAAPAFHDAQVQPGHTYYYAVSAIGQNGHESARSAETEEAVPNP
jgi:hypothetical protein